MADSFSKTFRPVTWECPKVLLPLVNVPMLEYTVEFLAQNGVEEIFVVCVWHAKQVQEYVDSVAKWPRSLIVRCIPMPACLSAGDALRELDSLGVIRSDPFVLISGDVISNMDLKKAIEFHKSRRKLDHNAILTVVLKPVHPAAGSKPLLDDLVVGIDKNSSQLVLFADNYRQKNAVIPLEVLADHPSVVLRTDLLDTHIDICSPEMMLQFSDNFDYQDIRKDFITNEVINWELGMHIYGHVLNNMPPHGISEYAARVQDPRTYHAICRDIVTRWVYPFVPDSYLLSDSTLQLMHGKRNVYRENGVQIARTASLGEGVVLGSGTTVAEHAALSRSILGRGCAIGAGSTVSESHLWAGACIGAGCVVTHAILAQGVVLKRGARVGRGCVLAANVVIGEDVHLPDFTRVSLQSHGGTDGECESDEDDEDDEDGWGGKSTMRSNKTAQKRREYDFAAVGKDGRGYVWTPPTSAAQDYSYSDDEAEDEGEGQGQGQDRPKLDELRARSLGCTEEEEQKRTLWRRMPEPEKDASDDDAFSEDEDEGAEMAAFVRMVGEMVITGHSEGHSADNLLMEVKGLKFAQNKTFADCLRGMLPELLALPLRGDQHARPMAIASQLRGLLSAGGWAYAMLKPFIQDEDDEVAIVEVVENAALGEGIAGIDGESHFRRIFRPILQILYDAELVTEEALLQWAEQRKAEVEEEQEEQGKVTSARLLLFQDPIVQEFVEWLEEEEEDDEEEESGDEESD